MKPTGIAFLVVLVTSGGCARRTSRSYSPPSNVASVMRRQVLNAAETGEGDPAVLPLRQQIAAEPDNPAPRLELASHFGKAGQPELEMEHLRLAVERFPASRDSHMALAQALRKAEQPRQAAETLERYLRANPNSTADPEVWNRLGVCRDEAGDWNAGEQAFRSGLAVSQDLDYLYNNLGYNLLEQQRTSEAVAVLKDALKHNPHSETARNNLGLALARTKGAPVGEALQHFENVADAATARSNLAAALMEQQRYDESRRLLQAALDYNRSSVVALANLALLAELDGKAATVPPPPARVTPWRWPAVLLKRILVPSPAASDQHRAATAKERTQGDKP